MQQPFSVIHGGGKQLFGRGKVKGENRLQAAVPKLFRKGGKVLFQNGGKAQPCKKCSGDFLGRLRLALFDFREIGNGANALTKPLLAPIFFKAGISD